MLKDMARVVTPCSDFKSVVQSVGDLLIRYPMDEFIGQLYNYTYSIDSCNIWTVCIHCLINLGQDRDFRTVRM